MTPAEANLYLTKFWSESGEVMWICSCTPDGDFILDEFNDAEKTLWGNIIQVGVSLKQTFGDCFHNETEGYRKCLASGKSEQFRQSLEIEGVERHFNLSLTPVFQNPEDVAPRIWGTAREITDLVQARIQIETINTVLEKRVAERTRTLHAANLELERVSQTDFLTGISNRRHFMALGAQELERARRYQTELSLLLIDLDKFKSVNDQHGHAAGDELLKRFTKTIAPEFRGNDVFARLGGDEFAILLPQAGPVDASILIRRIHELLAKMEAPVHAGRNHLSVTIGIAQLIATDHTIDDVLKRADAELYQAKPFQ